MRLQSANSPLHYARKESILCHTAVRHACTTFVVPPVQTPYRGMITLDDFENLSFYEKAQYLWDNGLYLSDRTYSQFRITLYYLDDYFAEVMYNRVGNKIISIASFDHKAVLLKYADEIELKDLF